MYKHILIPTDGSDISTTAVEQGLQLAKTLDAKVTLLTIVEPQVMVSVENVQLAGIGTDFLEMAREEAQKTLAEAETRAKELGVENASLIVDSTDPARTIVETAEEAGCDLVAMASHGRRGIGALVLGSVTTRVLNQSKVPVLVYSGAHHSA